MADVAGRDRPPLTIDVEQDPNRATVVLTGELDLSNVTELESVLEPVIESGPALLRFDLAGLRFMDSTGVALLLRSAARVGRVTVARPSAIVRRVLEATGLADVLPVEP